ncbi:MAG: isochorismatase family protein [Edaphobacter sp.]|uniref:cysteine hydrolase family protein n=1 Tax=Edaphobacter sp. TaxID=1934404 RepID=UPI0023A505F9|nr:isochorismatase family protein [Edaphobacter sp.]MDE1176656.1 isochorismatase family protein [Edaphobacter sp.]
MPITQIDPVSALIVIDLQNGIVAMNPEQAPAVVANSAKLIEAYRKRNLPVVLVNVAGLAPGRTSTPRYTGAFPPDWANLVSELNQQPTDILITKKSFGAFLGTALDEELKKRNVTQVVFCGIATSIGIESSARSAYDLGYNVAFVEDAMADLKPENHKHSIEVFFLRIGEIDTTENTLKLLQS